ncbi:MAG: hypothetical protein QFB86_02295 [Patescibacteria group bacterium]|nr:hypothetical protein [Patescibacteria group bacterium]
MPPEEPINPPDPGRQPRPRTRIAVDGFTPSRPDYGFRPSSRAVPVEQPQIDTENTPLPVQPFEPQPNLVSQSPYQPPAQPIYSEPASTPPQEPVLTATNELSSPPTPKSVPQPAAPSPALDFTPPPKAKRFKLRIKKPKLTKNTFRLSKLSVAIVGGSLLLILVTGAVYWKTHHASNSQALLTKALLTALNTKQLHAVTTGTHSATVDFDFSTPIEPVVSSKTIVDIAGSQAEVSGYGTKQSTYVSYTRLPSSVAPATAKSVTGNWVQFRSKGLAASGAPSALAHAGDPRYLVFGPLLFADVPKEGRKQIVDYINTHLVYDYTGTKPSTVKINDKKVVMYPVRVSVSELKIVNQSLATAMNLTSSDVQDAIAALDRLKGADVRIFVSPKNHSIARLEVEKNGKTETTDYSPKFTASAEPQTKLTWQTFAPQQFAMSAQVAAKLPADAVDTIRKKQFDTLHAQFKNYFTQTGSYPALSNINDPAWTAANLPGFDPDTFRDPTATNQVVLATPKPSSFAYQVVSDNPKVTCNNTAEIPCVHYKLTTVLSTKQPYTVQDP